MVQDVDECFYSYNVYIYVYFIEEVGLLIDQDDERWPAKDRYEFLNR